MTIERILHKSVEAMCRARILLWDLEETFKANGVPFDERYERAISDIDKCLKLCEQLKPTVQQLKQWEEEARGERGW